ncbi:MAG: hypothetical protein GY696_34590 [Gammaproteobacteria bacterium]|nr:hypothetical protein [Gammaproteobacteria bacterium]
MGQDKRQLPAANFYSLDRVSHPSLNLPGEGSVGGSDQQRINDDFFIDGRILFQ